MLKNKIITLLIICTLLSSTAMAENVVNKTKYIIEFTQMIGGYAANNPLNSHGSSALLPDPGATLLRGHIMVINPNVAGSYLDNIVFRYQNKNGSWVFTKVFDLYGQLDVNINTKGQLVIDYKN